MPIPSLTPMLKEIEKEKLPSIPSSKDFISSLKKVFPDWLRKAETRGYAVEETDPVFLEDITSFAETEPERFTEQLWEFGRTPETEAILKEYGVTDEEIESFYTPPEVSEEERQMREALTSLEPFKTEEGYDVEAARKAGISENILSIFFEPVGGMLPPLAFGEEAPPVDMSELLKDIYPEKFEPGVSYGYTEEELPQAILGDVLRRAEEEPEAFVKDLYGRTTVEQVERFLRAIGTEEKDIGTLTAFAEAKPFEIPPEGYEFIMEVEEPVEPYIREFIEKDVKVRKLAETRPVRKTALIKPDYTVWLEGKNIGTYIPETREIIPGPAPTFIEAAKEGLGEAWREYMVADQYSWGGGGKIALAALGVAGSYIEKYVGRPWETAILEARARFQLKNPLDVTDELNQTALDRLAEAREKYGFWSALTSEDVSDIWHDYLEETYGPANAMLKVSEWLNPAYVIPIGGIYGLGVRFSSKIPLIGKVVRGTAGGVQYVRGHTTLKLATYTTKGIERVGERIGEAATNRLIKESKHLEALLELPTSEKLLEGVLVDNWIKRTLTIASKIPPIRKGIEKGLGWRILTKRQSQAVEDIVGRAGVIHSEIMRRGPNAKAIKVWELREISGDPIKLFGFNDKAFAPRIRKLVTEADGTLEDIFTHPERYALSDKQLRYVTRVHEINTEITNFLKQEGVASEIVGQDWWIHRVVVGKFDANAELIRVRGRPGVRAGRIGSKPSFEMHRKAPTMAEGIEWGVLYSKNPEEYIATYIEEAFKKVADARVAKYVEAFGVKPSEIMAQRYPEIVERAVLTQAELGDAAHFNSVINRAIRGEKLPEQTLRAIERRFPELGKKFRGLAQEPVVADKQLRELLLQNERTIKNLTARLEKVKAVDVEAIKAEATAKARTEAMAEARLSIPEEGKLTEAFRIMDYEDRLAFRSTMQSQMDDVGRMLGEQEAELSGIREFLAIDPVATFTVQVGKRKVHLDYFIKKGNFPESFTVKEAAALMMKPEEQVLTRITKAGIRTDRVPREVVVGELAAYFKVGGQELIDRIVSIVGQRTTAEDLSFLVNMAGSRYKGIQRMVKVLDDVDTAPEFIPKAEAGMPEAGLQQDMFGFQTPHFPKGKGIVTQIGMDDYEKLVKVRKDAGLPPPEVTIKPKIEGVKGLEAETVVGKVSYEMPVVKTVAQRQAELTALRTEVKAITEARKSPFWKARTEQAEKMAEIRQPGIEKGFIMQPFAGGKIYDREFIDAFNKFFGYEKGLPGLSVVADVAGILRISKAALDLSAMAIQGLPSWGLAHTYLLTNPEMGAKLCGSWYKTFLQSSRAFFNPDILAGYIVKNKDLMSQMVALGSSARSVDYFAALGARHGIGGLGEAAMRKIPLKPYHRAEVAFFGAGQMIRTEFSRILLPKAIKRGQEIELMRILDRMTGITDPAVLGVPLTVRQLEQAVGWFAPSYTRACLTVLGDIFRGGYTGEMVRRALGGMISAGAIYYSGIQYAMATIEGKSNEEAWNTVKEGFCIFEDPITKEVKWKPSGRFMTFKVGNYYMGVGGFWYGLLRLAGNIMATVDEVGERERIDLVRIFKHGSLNKRDNPFVYWWYSRSSTTFGLGFELASGREFLGYPLETPQDYIEHILKKFEPIWMEQGINPFIPGMARENEIPEGVARQAVIPAEIFGLRTFPEGQWAQFYDKVNDYINRIPEEELDEKQKVPQQEGKLEWKHLTDIQKMNLLSRYPDVLETYEQAQADSQVRQSPHWEAWTGAKDRNREVYYGAGDILVGEVRTGVKDTREMRESWSDAGKTYGDHLNEMEEGGHYEAIYDYLAKIQSERGEKYGFVAELALAEYIDIMFADYTDEKGDFDWDKRDVAVDALIEKWGSDYYEAIREMYAQKRLLDDMNPVLVRLADDKDKLGRGYWRLPYKPISEMDEEDEVEGNISAEYLTLWKQAQALEGAELEAFIEAHPKLAKDWRAEYRLNNPEQDAMLALWGYGGKLQSIEAYDLVVKWGKELGIPLEQMGLGLPPQSLIQDYFDLNKIVDETSGSSVEARLFKLEHLKYLGWGLEQGIWKDDLSGEIIEELRIRANPQYKETGLEYDAIPKKYEDMADDIVNTMTTPEGINADWWARLTAEKKRSILTDIDRDTMLAGNEAYRKDSRRVEAYEKGIPEVEEYVEFNELPIKGKRRDRFLIEHGGQDPKNLTGFALIYSQLDKGHDIPTDVPPVEYDDLYDQFKDEFEKMDGFSDQTSEFFIELPEEGLTLDQTRSKSRDALRYVNGNPTNFYKAELTRQAYDEKSPTGERIPQEHIQNYVSHHLTEAKGYRDVRFLKEHNKNRDDYYKAVWLGILKNDRVDFGKVPAKQYDDLSDQFKKQFDLWDAYKDPKQPELYKADPDDRRIAREKLLTQKVNGMTFDEARLRQSAYLSLIGHEEYVEDYVEFYQIKKPDNWKRDTLTDLYFEDDWFLDEHKGFYDLMYDLKWTEKRDFSKVPSRKVFKKYLAYLYLPEGKRRDDYRFANLDLDSWLVLKGYTPITEQKRRAGLTPREEGLEDVAKQRQEWRDIDREIDRILEGIGK